MACLVLEDQLVYLPDREDEVLVLHMAAEHQLKVGQLQMLQLDCPVVLVLLEDFQHAFSLTELLELHVDLELNDHGDAVVVKRHEVRVLAPSIFPPLLQGFRAQACVTDHVIGSAQQNIDRLDSRVVFLKALLQILQAFLAQLDRQAQAPFL